MLTSFVAWSCTFLCVLGSKLLPSVQNYEVVHISTEHFKTVDQWAENHGLHEHPDRTSFDLSAHGQQFTVKGFKQKNLLAEGYHEQRQSWRDGKLADKRTTRVIDSAANCWYHGHVDSRQGFSKAAFSTCSGSFRGHVSLYADTFVIEPAHKHLDERELNSHLQRILAKDEHRLSKGSDLPSHQSLHVVYKSEDVEHPRFFCPVEDAVTTPIDTLLHKEGEHKVHDHDHDDHDHHHDYLSGFLAQINSHLTGSKIQTASKTELNGVQQKANGQQWIELIIVNDKRRFDDYREEPEDDTVDIVNLVNSYYVDQVFDPPIEIVLINQITFDTEDPWEADNPLGTCSDCSSTECSVDTLLSEFNTFRSDTNNIGEHDNAQLFSAHDFQGGVLGYAAVSGMCQASRSSGINMTPSSQSLEFTSAIVAHEMGHNMGCSHDSSSNTCPSTGYLMNAEVSGSNIPTTFSECSEDYVTSYMGTSSVTCSMNEPTNVWGEPQCQNGWVEVGEDCDCGEADCSATDPCCDGATCTFVEGALCSEVDPCCESCQPKAAGELCREMTGDEGCDLAEYCDGVTGSCPADGVIGPGASCSYEIEGEQVDGLCYYGSCYNAYRQCYETGAGFDGSPFNHCPYESSVSLNGWYETESTIEEQEEYFCSTLWCSNDPSTCTYFRVSGQVSTVDDGVPCSQLNTKQCLNSECVDSSELNSEYGWVATAWNDCAACDEEQERDVVCEAISTPGVQVDSLLCSVSNQLETTQLCDNETLACDHNQGLADNELDIFGVVVSQNTLVFSSLGVLSGFAILLLCCYQAVTFVDDEQDQGAGANGGSVRRKAGKTVNFDQIS